MYMVLPPDTPRRLYYVHIASWVMNMFGIFFVLAAHEHYSIDVFIAFYITSRMFLYYHSLANNRALHQRDSFRTKIWFPMFSYFESNIDGIVPNEYSNLLSTSNIKWSLRQLYRPIHWVAVHGKVAILALSGITGWREVASAPQTSGTDCNATKAADGISPNAENSNVSVGRNTNNLNNVKTNNNNNSSGSEQSTNASRKGGFLDTVTDESQGTLPRHISASDNNNKVHTTRKRVRKTVGCSRQYTYKTVAENDINGNDNVNECCTNTHVNNIHLPDGCSNKLDKQY